MIIIDQWVKKQVQNAMDLTRKVQAFPLGDEVRIYPFRIVSGAVTMNKNGIANPYNTTLNNMFQYQKVFTGNNPITVVWDNSTKLIGSGNKLTKSFSVGRIIKGYVSEEYTLKANAENNFTLFGMNYNTTETQNSFQLWFDDTYQWGYANGQALANLPTDEDVQNYFYIVLDVRYQTYQFCKIQSRQAQYKTAISGDYEEPQSLLGTAVNFTTINLDFASTGKSILQFCSLGALGEGFAFPYEYVDDEGQIQTKLDANFMSDNPCFSIQVDFMNSYALSSMQIIGRPSIENLVPVANSSFHTPIAVSQLLVPYTSLAPLPSPFIEKLPIQNCYVGNNLCTALIEVWDNYKTMYSGTDQNSLMSNFNITASKTVLGGLAPLEHFKQQNTPINWSVVKNSNPLNASGTYQNVLWNTPNIVNPQWIQYDTKIDTGGLPYVSGGTPTVSWTSSGVGDYLFRNMFHNWNINQLQSTFEETTIYHLSQFTGVLGKIVSMLTGGIDLGWQGNKNIFLGNSANYLIPTVSFNIGMSALSDSAPLPLDLFTDNLSQKMLPFPNNQYVAYHLQLTDQIITTQPSLIVEGAEIGKGGNGVWNTIYLGQNKDEEGNNLLADGSYVIPQIELIKGFSPSPKAQNGFIVDYFETKGLGMCDKRISAYKKPNSEYNYPESVFEAFMETYAKAKNNIYVWNDNIKFNYYDEFNTLGTIDYPKIPYISKPSNTFNTDKLNKAQNQTTFKNALINAVSQSSGGKWENCLNKATEQNLYYNLGLGFYTLSVDAQTSPDQPYLGFTTTNINYAIKPFEATFTNQDYFKITELDTFNSLSLIVKSGIPSQPLVPTKNFPVTLSKQELSNLASGSTVIKQYTYNDYATGSYNLKLPQNFVPLAWVTGLGQALPKYTGGSSYDNAWSVFEYTPCCPYSYLNTVSNLVNNRISQPINWDLGAVVQTTQNPNAYDTVASQHGFMNQGAVNYWWWNPVANVWNRAPYSDIICYYQGLVSLDQQTTQLTEVLMITINLTFTYSKTDGWLNIQCSPSVNYGYTQTNLYSNQEYNNAPFNQTDYNIKTTIIGTSNADGGQTYQYSEYNADVFISSMFEKPESPQFYNSSPSISLPNFSYPTDMVNLTSLWDLANKNTVHISSAINGQDSGYLIAPSVQVDPDLNFKPNFLFEILLS